MIGLSGGVDSATATALLLQKKHHVQPVFMHNWEEDDHCHISEDIDTCHQICQHFDLTLDVINFQKEYFKEVFETSLNLFDQGLTPNPDILCNRYIKFNHLIQYAQSQGFDGLATGHYAQIEQRDGEFALIQAPDPVKDQTYFLSQLTQEQLSYAVFPLGQYQKRTTRELAKTLNLPNAQKKDSVGICFIGERKFAKFLQEYLLTRPGSIITRDGLLVGKHQGLFCYTIGQRKGLGIGGVKNTADTPWYVIDKCLEQNQLIVSQNHDDLMKSSIKIEPIHWIRQSQNHTHLHAKLRHGPEMIECHVQDQLVVFSSPQLAPTPGQYIVFYQNNECLGSSMILESFT